MSKVSIIANFYKVEKYIPMLVESVINQTYQDWELICVNDCSPGNDLAILKLQALKDKRIKIVDNKVNLGMSKARFEGVKHASGKYIMFIDGDDWLNPEALERCIEPAETYCVDMVIMSMQKVYHKGINWYVDKMIQPDTYRIIKQPELFNDYYVNFFGKNIFSVSLCAKLIRRDVFLNANLKSQDFYFAEDLMVNMYLFPHLQSMYMIDYVGYNWRWGGITSGKEKETEEKNLRLLDFSLELYDKRMVELEKYNYSKGKRYMTAELSSYLIGYLSYIAVSDTPSKDICKMIRKYLDVLKGNDIYISDLNSEKYQVIRTNDVYLVYKLARTKYKKDFLKRTFKRVFHLFV